VSPDPDDPPLGFGDDGPADVDPDDPGAITVELSERFLAAAAEWADQRVMTEDHAVESKVEQALLEVEHLVSGGTSVAFAVDGETAVVDPSDELAAFLNAQAERLGVEPAAVLGSYVDLFARVFLNDDAER